MKNSLVFLLCFVSFTLFSQQEEKHDSTALNIDEVIIIAKSKLNNYGEQKSLSSIDEFLERSNQISMIKRGSYAWEPTINNMVSDRLNVTIDGMQIYGACTDKMDPVTSYVDVSNLDKVVITSGQEGTENSNCIGGSIDMVLPSSNYSNAGWKTNIDLGYESNGNYLASGMDVRYSGKKIFGSADVIFRKAGNYRAGGGEEVQFSQFQKINSSFQLGYLLSENHKLEAFMIYDKATDVGYTALPMDVSLAEAKIISLTHFYHNKKNKLYQWQTKVYMNSITHVMDDTKRPEVPIHMDMPGWSDTYGFYSKINYRIGKHHLLFNFNGNHNRSIAEMTMYPNDPTENDMFMYTWPDVKTKYGGLYIKDHFMIDNNNSISLNGRLGIHVNRIDNKVGLQSLQIYYPTMEVSRQRALNSLSLNYEWKHNAYKIEIGGGYGERAPSVSEGYGFYLFNSFDNYDYIGNPFLENEQSLESSLKINYNKNKLSLEGRGSYFYIRNYIIGQINPDLVAMTIGADGVRVYHDLPSATIFSSSLSGSYKLNDELVLKASLGYNYGKGSNKEDLPLVRPISYLLEMNYNHKRLTGIIRFRGDGNQTHYSMDYGEDETPAYSVLDVSSGYKWIGDKNVVILKVGIDNILDKKYSTYSDWNNIYRQGRNVFMNLSYLLR